MNHTLLLPSFITPLASPLLSLSRIFTISKRDFPFLDHDHTYYNFSFRHLKSVMKILYLEETHYRSSS